MDIKYFSYPADRLNEGKIPVKCLGDSGEVFTEMALTMLSIIEENNKKGDKTVFIVPVGPVGQYPIFVRYVIERKLSLKNVWLINMDEYLDDNKNYLPMEHRLSFRGFMERNLYSKLPEELNVPKEQRIFPDPNDTTKILRLIEKLGKVDACFGGIGINGHVAFNESEEVSADEFATRETRVLKISHETRTANAIGDLNGAIDAMPNYAITIGMREILMSKRIVLGVFRTWHRSVLREAVFGEMSGHFPVTLLQAHNNALILANNIASEIAF